MDFLIIGEEITQKQILPTSAKSRAVTFTSAWRKSNNSQWSQENDPRSPLSEVGEAPARHPDSNDSWEILFKVSAMFRTPWWYYAHSRLKINLLREGTVTRKWLFRALTSKDWVYGWTILFIISPSKKEQNQTPHPFYTFFKHKLKRSQILCFKRNTFGCICEPRFTLNVSLALF